VKFSLKRFPVLLCSALSLALLMPCATRAQAHDSWHLATPAELAAALPSRAPVVRERIETEMSTASGIVDRQGKMIAGVVMITAGYSADGKYSHYMLVQAPITAGNVAMVPGTYVFGWKRVDAGLDITFYDAMTGSPIGSAVATLLPSGIRVASFRMWLPTERSVLQIGRFGLPYHLGVAGDTSRHK
jgi:hypothetical protein